MDLKSGRADAKQDIDDIDRRLAFSSYVHSYVSEYVRFSDTKAGFVLATAGVILVIVLQKISGWTLAASSNWGAVEVIRGLLVLAFLISEVSVFFFGLNSITATLSSDGTSLVAFPDLSSRERGSYAEDVKTSKPELFVEEIAKHSVDLSRIAEAKYKHVNKSIWCLRLTIVVAVIIMVAV